MNEFLTIEQDFDTPMLDAAKKRARKQQNKNRKPFQERKVPFAINPAWKRCATGREEYAV